MTPEEIKQELSEALEVWDAGEIVTVELAGLGSVGYEQACQVIAWEVVRHHLESIPSVIERLEAKDEAWWADFGSEVIEREDEQEYGRFSGAQVGAGKFFAASLLKNGYDTVLGMADKDRLITVPNPKVNFAGFGADKDA